MPGSYDVSNISYDLDGNIKSVVRNDDLAAAIDELTYNYTNGNNQLSTVY